MRRLPAEWEKTDAILISWPHSDTDWADILPEVEECYVNMATAIIEFSNLIVISPEISRPQELLKNLPQEKIEYHKIQTNDTWTRDYGPITIYEDNKPVALDFQFNGWGLKFASDCDNLVTSRLHLRGVICKQRENRLGFTLEGGSIETDGKGTLLTTSSCLLSPNRNGDLSKGEIESYLYNALGISKINWLNCGYLDGDDTDSHIDTLARITPNDTILYVATNNKNDEHYDQLKEMERQLSLMTNVRGEKYNLVKLPLPSPIFDLEGQRLPATYANYLVVNNAVIVPTYSQKENDDLALGIISEAFPNYIIKAVDCCPLIKQHGSLHCSTIHIIK